MRIRLLPAALAVSMLAQIAPLDATPASAAPSQAVRRAVDWFLRNKAADGALPGYENGYTLGGTADAIFALAAAGEDPRRFGRKMGGTPVDYLQAHAADNTPENEPRDDAHLAGKVAVAAAIAGHDPGRFGGADLVGFIRDRYDPATGGYRGGFEATPFNPLGQSLAVLGLIAAEEPVPTKAVDHLLESQLPDGGWEFGIGFGSDVTSSSMAVQALGAFANATRSIPRIEAARRKSVTFFEAEQNEDGGFSNQKKRAGNFCAGSKPSEVDATGFAIGWAMAVGQNSDGGSWVKPGANTPRGFLRSVQNPDGSFSFQEGPDCKGNGGSTYAAILGVERFSFPEARPLAGPARSPASEEDRLSGEKGGGPDPFLWAGLGAILLLCGSVGRQLLRKKR